jgi:hypothetical protein
MSGSLAWRLGLAALIALAGPLGSAGCARLTGPSSIDDQWVLHESPHFLLHARPESFASQHAPYFADVLEDQLAVSLAVLDARYDGRLFGFFFGPGDGGLAGGRIREGVAFPLNGAFKLAVAPPLDDDVLVLMAHEANHVIAEHVLGRPGTSFVNEGLASALLSERYHQLGPTFLHAWAAAAESLPPLSRLVDDDAWDGIDQRTKYNASASFLAYLLETHGAVPFRQLWGVPSDRFEDRFREVYGQSLTASESAWQAFVAR